MYEKRCFLTNYRVPMHEIWHRKGLAFAIRFFYKLEVFIMRRVCVCFRAVFSHESSHFVYIFTLNIWYKTGSAHPGMRVLCGVWFGVAIVIIGAYLICCVR